jgi:biotin carboxylase
MDVKKKILFLGGADIQVSAIILAKQLGYYVITCDYLPNNPGHKFSDEYHNVSTTDKEGVLALASSLNIDGILAYASDPAAPTAAYVAEKLGLPTNPFEVVNIMSRKDLFREFLEANNFDVPLSTAVTSYEDAFTFANRVQKKMVIKPVDSSGSKGVYVIEPNESFTEEFQKALSFSRVGKVIIEEFITKKRFQVGGDGFIVNGELVFRCFGDIHFSKTNPMLPCSVSVPTLHDKEIVDKIHIEVQRLFSLIGMRMGAVNFDIMVDEDDRVFILEIGPRNGGNMIPELTEYCTGVDMKTYSIRAALGEDCSSLKMGEEKTYFSHYVVHAAKSGYVKGVSKSEKLEKALLYEHYNFEIGSKVEVFQSSANRLGVLLLKYKSEEEMLDLIYNMDLHLIIEIANDDEK